jgi:hypothetical protein
MTKFLILIILILIVYLALAVPNAGGAPGAASRATHTPLPPTVELPTITPGIVPTDYPAYPAPEPRHGAPKATPARGLQCARC